MWNRYWNFTGCINYDDIYSLKSNIVNLFERQGATYLGDTIPSKTLLDRLPKQKQHPADQSSFIWIVALYPGTNRWTIIKTYPSELLCHSVIIDFESMSLMYFQPPKGYEISVTD